MNEDVKSPIDDGAEEHAQTAEKPEVETSTEPVAADDEPAVEKTVAGAGLSAESTVVGASAKELADAGEEAPEAAAATSAAVSAAPASSRHVQLVVGGIILVVILIIVGLFLPPISLGDRLGFTGDDTPEPTEAVALEPTEEVTVEEGFSLLLSDPDAKVKGGTIPTDDFLSGSEEEWAAAASSLPADSSLVSDLYTLEFKDEAPNGSVEIEIPAEAAPYQTLDLFYWDGEQWTFAPSAVNADSGILTSFESPLPPAFALFQSSSPVEPEISAEVLPAQSLPAAVLPYLTEVSAGTLTLGSSGVLVGDIVEVPTGGYEQLLRATNTGAVVDTVSLSTLLEDTNLQQTNIQTLVARATDGGFAGVNLDYQGVSTSEKSAFTGYVQNLADALHEVGLKLYVTLEAPIATDTGLDTGGQDWAAVGQAADKVYAQMPLDPTIFGDSDLVEQILVWATRQIDRRKMLMLNTVNAIDSVGDSSREVHQDQALENYGELILTGDGGPIEPGQPVEAALSGSAGALEWDPESLTYRYTYDQSGQPHSVWLGSEALLSYRNRLADRYHLGGIAARGLGNVEAAQGYADALASYVGQGTAPQPASAAIVWAVEDEEGAIVASSSGEDMTYSWEGSMDPGRYLIRADFAQGDSVASLGSVEVVIAEAEEPTPTPEPESEPEPTPTPETVVDANPGSVDPGDADAAASAPANVRNGPGLAYGIIGGLDVGEKVSLIGRNEDQSWFQIRMSDDSEGWVFAQLLTVNASVDTGALAVVEVEPPVVASGGDSGDTGGQPTTPPVIAPAAGGSFELGGQTHSLANPSLMSLAGMNWVKFQHKWGPGDSPDAVAGRIQQAHANGFKVLLSIPGSSSYPSSIDFNGYVEFLRGVAALGPDAIEIWNEENIDFEWPAGQIDPSSYVNNMLAPAYNAIKSANSNVMVISGAPAPTGYFGGGCSANGCDDNAYMAGVAAAGGGNYMDCIGVHYNAGATSPNASSGHPAGGTHYSWYFWPTLNMYYNAFGGSRKVCFTELGYLSGQDFGGVPSRFSWAGNTTVAQHAQWLAEAASLSANSGKVRM
ncbi:MAG: SH3 domain-containing protein, partial [Candidatus Promineifilaceae bacterium]